jgi:hypothetical protein
LEQGAGSRSGHQGGCSRDFEEIAAGDARTPVFFWFLFSIFCAHRTSNQLKVIIILVDSWGELAVSGENLDAEAVDCVWNTLDYTRNSLRNYWHGAVSQFLDRGWV